MKQFVFLALALALPAGSTHADEPDTGKVARGAYLARVMDCGGCHTPRGPDGVPDLEKSLTGGTVGFEIPGLGTF